MDVLVCVTTVEWRLKASLKAVSDIVAMFSLFRIPLSLTKEEFLSAALRVTIKDSSVRLTRVEHAAVNNPHLVMHFTKSKLVY